MNPVSRDGREIGRQFGPQLNLTPQHVAAYQSDHLPTPEPKFTMEQAKEIALRRVSGNVEGYELKREHGHLVYSFDIRNAKGTITEVQVEARTGKVVRVKEKNAKQEADQKRQEGRKP